MLKLLPVQVKTTPRDMTQVHATALVPLTLCTHTHKRIFDSFALYGR